MPITQISTSFCTPLYNCLLFGNASQHQSWVVSLQSISNIIIKFNIIIRALEMNNHNHKCTTSRNTMIYLEYYPWEVSKICCENITSVTTRRKYMINVLYKHCQYSYWCLMSSLPRLPFRNNFHGSENKMNFLTMTNHGYEKDTGEKGINQRYPSCIHNLVWLEFSS